MSWVVLGAWSMPIRVTECGYGGHGGTSVYWAYSLWARVRYVAINKPPGGRAEGGDADGSQDRDRARMARSLQDECRVAGALARDFASGTAPEPLPRAIVRVGDGPPKTCESGRPNAAPPWRPTSWPAFEPPRE